jgi:poly(3-hydroxybutyrate) depolymerase
MDEHGASSHIFADPRSGPRREIAVFTHRPESFHPDSPVVVVMHGRNRNGHEYRDWFRAQAERYGFLVVAPNFPEAQYAHPHEYSYGAMVDAADKPRPREEWLWLGRKHGPARRAPPLRREVALAFPQAMGRSIC